MRVRPKLFRQSFPSRGHPVTNKSSGCLVFFSLQNVTISALFACPTRGKRLEMPKRTYTEAFSFVPSSPTHCVSSLTMDSNSPPTLDPTTPQRKYAPTKLATTPNKLGTVAHSSQPVGSTQHVLQASLTGNIVFCNEAIVDAVFQPFKVDDQTVMEILAEIVHDRSLKAARRSVLSNKLTETKKYKSLVRH